MPQSAWATGGRRSGRPQVARWRGRGPGTRRRAVGSRRGKCRCRRRSANTPRTCASPTRPVRAAGAHRRARHTQTPATGSQPPGSTWGGQGCPPRPAGRATSGEHCVQEAVRPKRGRSDKWQPRRHEEQECSHVLALESPRAVSGNGSQEAEDTVPELGWFQQLPCTPRGETSSERVGGGSSSSSRSHRNGRVQSQRWVVRQRIGTWESPQ